jgi:hypothetical protein
VGLEQPLLRLGLLGFPDEVALRLQASATDLREGWPIWRCGDPHQADAWMINGAAVQVLGRDEVVIAHPLGSSERLALHRAEVDRPLAFAEPLPEGFASAEFFDANDEHSVRQRLQRFEAWLRPLRSQFALGAAVAQRRAGLSGVVHLMHQGRLLAVLDFARWRAGIFVPARPVELSMADWVPQLRSDGDIPTSFIRLPLHRVMWTYAVRTTSDVLPVRYRTQTIYLRRVPMVPAKWFDPVHLELMRLLTQEPGNFEDLLVRTGLDPVDMAHHLAALFHSGGLTTDADSARRAENHTRHSIRLLKLDQDETDSDLLNRFRSSDAAAPSSILREALDSPLRSVDRPV